MGYKSAMEAAGAEVVEFQTFGSYQGDWWASVRFEGKAYWVHGSYGSCSGCDAFQSQFDYNTTEQCEEHRYDNPSGEVVAACVKCTEAKAAYAVALAEFGRSYLQRNEFTQEEAEKETFKEADDYSDYNEEKEQHDFIKAHPLV